MADCLAGVWANHATETKGESTSGGEVAFLKPLTDQDIKDALSAASSVGDDRIQEKTQGRVSPESWTHGSAAARQKWFTTGYKTRRPQPVRHLQRRPPSSRRGHAQVAATQSP